MLTPSKVLLIVVITAGEQAEIALCQSTSLYVMAGSPLCEPAYPQLVTDRHGRSYVFSWGLPRPTAPTPDTHLATGRMIAAGSPDQRLGR
jgi:hypothetical protein